MKALGRHIVCELSGCHPSLLSDINGIAAMMIAAAKAARATIMESAFHRFEPQGVSGTVILAESHLSIHTWPEKGYAAMDFYTCGDHTDPWLACEHAAQALARRAFSRPNSSAESRRATASSLTCSAATTTCAC